MNKKSKLAILGATLAVVGAFGYSAYAASGENSPNGPEKMLDKAVEKGIISEEKKEELKQFSKEEIKKLMQERMEERLNKAIEEGTITSEEAQEIKDWMSLRPETMDKLSPMGKFGKKGFGMGKEKFNTESNTQ